MKARILLPVTTSLICGGQALAEPVSTDAASIVVLGESLPLPPGATAYGSVTINRDKLLNSASGMLENVLEDVAGFQQFRRSDSRSANPSAQGATLRALGGNASSRTLVLLDGVPVADPFFGYIPFNALVPDRLSLIRVTRGGGVGAFGAGAVAGTVELAAATRNDLPLFDASAWYGSRDATSLSVTASPDLGGGFISVSGRWDRGDGFWTTPTAQRVTASAPARYENWSTSARAVVPVGDALQLQAHALIFRDSRTLRFAGADSHNEGQDASIRIVGGRAWKIDALAYVQVRNFSNIVISSNPPFRKSLDQRDTPSTGFGGKIEIRPPIDNAHVMRIGIDTRFANGNMHENAYNAGLTTNPLTSSRHAMGDQNTTGLFIEDDWSIGNLMLTAGTRADHWSIRNSSYTFTNPAGVVDPAKSAVYADRSGWESSFRAGARLALDDQIALRLAGYTGFRLPTLNELYRPFVVFPITTNANPNLKPERMKGIEGGIDLTLTEGVKLSATAFYNRLDNAIANVTLSSITRERRNVKAIDAKGLEFNASTKLGDFNMAFSYAYTDSKMRAPGQFFDDLRPAQTPRHSASAMLGYEPENGPALSASLHYIGKQYEDDLNADSLKGALTVDTVARLPLGDGITVIGRAENIFDETVITRNAAGSIDLGTPQTFWIGIRFEK